MTGKIVEDHGREDGSNGSVGLPAGAPARFALRVAALAWPLLAYWFVTAAPGTVAGGDGGIVRCAPLWSSATVVVLTLPGVVALVIAANAAGTWRRRGIAAAVVTAAVSAAIVLAAVSGAVTTTTCQLWS